MPTPRSNEDHDSFIERCIPIVIDEGTAEDNDQAVAYCESIWEENMNGLQKLLRKLNLE
jgi:hypothetical protein